LPLDGLYQTACKNAEQVTQKWAEKIMKQGAWQKKKELGKIAGDYGELAAELQKKLTGTEDPKKRLASSSNCRQP